MEGLVLVHLKNGLISMESVRLRDYSNNMFMFINMNSHNTETHSNISDAIGMKWKI